MKRIVTCIIGSFLFCEAAICQGRVEADIIGLKNDKGICRACLFNSQASFNGVAGEPLQCVAVPVKNGVTQIAFSNVLAGIYAVFVFHDANSNNKMDKNFIGIPKEGYGASKNKLPFAGAPTFNDNKFTVENKSVIKLQIRIRNL
jgi:uncharacterized protein (DUF2141 family)